MFSFSLFLSLSHIYILDGKVMHEVVNLILAEGNKGVSTLKACIHVAELVQAEVRCHAMFSVKACRKMYQN